ncbi:replication-associated protein [Capybara virus 15_cap1_294]|nr:replication-associated protein [Capybara virus 15_cap1_294]
MSRTFQLNSKQLFLTYPQCPLDKEEALMLLQHKLAAYSIDKYIVAHELHANGDDHLHCYFKLNEPYRTRDPKDLDLREFHGNYQGCRSAKNVVKYCSKAEDYLSNFDIGDVVNGDSKTKIAMQRILAGDSLTAIVNDHPMLLKGYRNLKLDIDAYREDLVPEKPDLPDFLPNPWSLILPTWGKHKRRHYWLWSSEPNLGKTTKFAKPLSAKYRGEIHTGDFTYWNVSRHDQFLILDDFNTAKVKYDVLNQLCDNTYSFKKIYVGNIKITNDYIVIVLSNCSIDTLYPHMNKFLYERFEEIKLD